MNYPKHIIHKAFGIKLSLLTFLVIGFVFAGLSHAQGDAAKGKALFNSNCAACHKLDQKMTGPPLRNISERHDKEWLYKWIRNSAAFIKSGDAEAIKVFEENNKVPMNAFPQLSNEDIDNILAYTSEPSPKLASGAAASAGATTAEASGGVSWEFLLGVLASLLLVFAIVGYRVRVRVRRILEASGRVVDKKPFKLPPFVKFVLVIFIILIIIYYLYAFLMQVGVDQGYKPVQPIHFSHKIHSGDNKIECLYCHSSARVSKTSGVPSVNVCMNCHKNISEYNGEEDLANGHNKAFYDAEIQKIYMASGWDPQSQKYTGKTQPIKWVRIHNLPDFVYFNHSQHVTVAGVECQKCHGPVEEMSVLYQHEKLTMGWCVNCHRTTDVNMKDNGYYEKIHSELAGKYGVDKLTIAQMGGLECGKCHY